MFAIDFTKPYLYKDVVYFHQGNLSTNNTLRCTLNTGGSNDLTGCNIICTFKLQNSTEISGAGRIIDPLNAIVDLVFPSNALAVGLNKLEILVNRSDGSVAQSPSITYDIWQGLTTGNGIEAETNYPILIELINSTNEASNKANLALNKANSMITDITDAIDNAYRSANEADIATSNANTKVEEVETAKTEMIKKVDTSIVTMKSEVETAKNEMTSKADEKIADVDRALAAGTVDLEVKQARKDASGVVYENLKQMLDANLGVEGKTLKDLVIDMNNMKEMQDLEYSTDKGYAVCEKTGNGTVKDLKIYGRSFVNITQFKDETLTLTEGKYYNDILICPVNRISVNKDYLFSYDIEIISNTTTTILGTNSSCQFGVGVSGFKTHPTMQVDGKTGFTVSSSSRNSFKINVSDFKGEENFRLRPLYPAQAPIPTGQSITYKVKNMMLIEYTQNPPSGYVEGIASVGNGNEIEVLSRKEDGNLIANISEMFKNNNYIYVQPYFYFPIYGIDKNSNYSINLLASQLPINSFCNINREPKYDYPNQTTCLIKDISGNLDKTYQIRQETLNKHSQNDVLYVSIANDSFNKSKLEEYIVSNDFNVIFYKGDKKPTINSFKQDKKTPLYKDIDGIWKPITELRGYWEDGKFIWGDILDSIACKLYLRSVKKNISGIENWIDVTSTDDTSGTGKYLVAKVASITSVENNIICDRFPIKTPFSIKPFDGEAVCINKFGFTLKILKTKANDIPSLKQYLQTKSFDIIIECDEKVYETNPIYPEAFEDETLMLFKTGPISPRATWKITSNLVGVLGNVKDRVKRMENDFYKYTVTQNRMQLGTTYSSDRTTFRVDTATFTTEKSKQDLDYDLFRLLRHNILVGPHNYDKAEMENMMDFYVSVGKIDYNMWDELYMLIEEQHNPPVEEETPVI